MDFRPLNKFAGNDAGTRESFIRPPVAPEYNGARPSIDMATVNVRAARAIVAIGVEFIFSGRRLDRCTEFPQIGRHQGRACTKAKRAIKRVSLPSNPENNNMRRYFLLDLASLVKNMKNAARRSSWFAFMQSFAQEIIRLFKPRGATLRNRSRTCRR